MLITLPGYGNISFSEKDVAYLRKKIKVQKQIVIEVKGSMEYAMQKEIDKYIKQRRT